MLKVKTVIEELYSGWGCNASEEERKRRLKRKDHELYMIKKKRKK